MKPIEEVYPECAKEQAEDGSFYGPGGYGPLLDSLGYETVVRVDDEDYQGDSRLLLRDGERWGLLVFGWGSCSGCDALQACTTMKEISDLRENIHGQIHWGPSRTALLAYVTGKDWEAEWSYNSEEGKRFVEQATVALREA